MISALQLPVSRSSFALRIASMDSFFDASMKPQVFTITTSASCAFGVTCIPSRNSEPSMTSLSTRFFAQPRLTNPTLIGDDDCTVVSILRRSGLYPRPVAIANRPYGRVGSNSEAGAGFGWYQASKSALGMDGAAADTIGSTTMGARCEKWLLASTTTNTITVKPTTTSPTLRNGSFNSGGLRARTV